MKNNKGFAPVLILLAVLAVLAIGGGAYYVGTKNSPSKESVVDDNYQPVEQNAPEVNPKTSTPTAESIKVTFPTTGSTLTEGQTYSITWENSNAANATYGIYLENDKAGSIRIGETSKKSFSWKVPSILDYMNGGDSVSTVAPVDGYRISLTNLSDSKKYYSSVFKIFPLVAQDVKFTFPTAGSTLIEGQTYTITWINSNANTTYGLYLENDQAGSIRIGETSNKSISWTVPSILGYMNGGDSYHTVAPVDGYRIFLFTGNNIKDMKKYYSPVFKIIPKN